MNSEKDCMLNYEWQNAHHNVSFIAERYYDVWNRNKQNLIVNNSFHNWHAGLNNLQKVLEEAESKTKQIRALGAGWSLSEVTVCKHYLLNTRPLDIAFIGLPDDNVTESKDAHVCVLAQCGVSVSQLNRWLFNSNLALPTSGSSDGQTIVGAMSTGTHGGAFHVGSVQDYIYGIHLMTSSLKHYWIEGNKKVLTDLAVLNFYGTGVTRINDDDVFNSSLVAFGSFGIISSVLLKVEPLYRLNLFQRYYSFEQVKPCLTNPDNLNSLGLPNNPHYFELVLNPYKPQEVIARIMYKKDVQLEALAPEITYSLGVDLVEAFGEIADKIPLSVAAILGFLEPFLKKKYKQIPNGQLSFPGDVFSGGYSGFRGKGVSMELGIDANDAPKALQILYQTAQNNPLPGIIGVRYIKKSKAFLSIARFDLTCTIEIPAAFSKTSQRFYQALWSELDKNGITYTFHWGQMNNLDAEKVKNKWGADVVNTWLNTRRRLLPTVQQQQMFSNDFLIRCGLNL